MAIRESEKSVCKADRSFAGAQVASSPCAQEQRAGSVCCAARARARRCLPACDAAGRPCSIARECREPGGGDMFR